MNINQDLQEQLFRQREEQICHLDYNQEFRYYNAVASGDMESVKEYLMPENDDAYSGSEYGKLSQNSLWNAGGRGFSGRGCGMTCPSTARQNSGRVSGTIRTANAVPTKPNERRWAIRWHGCTTRGGTVTISSTGRTITPEPSNWNRWKCRCGFWRRCSVTELPPARST